MLNGLPACVVCWYVYGHVAFVLDVQHTCLIEGGLVVV